jgi:hypothetical protein
MFSTAPTPLHLGVWQMTSPVLEAKPVLFEALDPSQTKWVVTAVKRSKVSVQKGPSLRHLLQLSLTACGIPWPPLGAESEWLNAGIHLTLFLPDDCFYSFKMPCMPQWGPQDIEAECRLEAARLMRRLMASLILDFEVQAMPESALVAHVMVCENAMVEAAMHMFEKLGLKLNSLTCHSDLQAYAHGWKVSPDLLNGMVHEAVDAC